MKTKFMYLIVAALMVGSQLSLSAQNKDAKAPRQRPTQEQMLQRQSSLMVKTLMLDDKTAAKFAPVYEKYLKELRECRLMNFKPRAEKPQGQRPAVTDEDIAKMIKGQFAQSRKMLDVREKYYNEFSKVLSQKQIRKIYQQEKNNAGKFKKEFERRKGQKMGQGFSHRGGQKFGAPK